jgi:hypothetical protein
MMARGYFLAMVRPRPLGFGWPQKDQKAGAFPEPWPLAFGFGLGTIQGENGKEIAGFCQRR